MCQGPPLRPGILAFLYLLSSSAFAGGLDGSAIPGAGGGFSGPADPGARGIIYNPAAIGQGKYPEVLIDLGVFRQELRTTLDDLNDLERSAGFELQPSAALAIPLKGLGLPVGIGAFVHGPYARVSGSDSAPTNARRFFSKGGELVLVEGGLVGSATFFDRLTVAAGLRIGQASFGSDTAIDFGYFLNDALTITGDDALPVGDPLFEGEQNVGRMTGTGVSWMAGATARLPADVELHFGYRPPWGVKLTGPVVLRPSNDLDALVAGDGEVVLPFPARMVFAARVPIGKLTLLPELEWVGWRGASDAAVTVSNLTFDAADPEVTLALLQIEEEADLLSAAEGDSVISLGWQNVVHPGLQAQYDFNEEWSARAGLLWGRSAVPDPVVTPANVDFEVFTLRAAGAWQPLSQIRLTGTVEAFPSPVRVISGNPPTNPTVPSGNGRYQLILWRAGITAQFFLALRQESS